MVSLTWFTLIAIALFKTSVLAKTNEDQALKINEQNRNSLVKKLTKLYDKHGAVNKIVNNMFKNDILYSQNDSERLKENNLDNTVGYKSENKDIAKEIETFASLLNKNISENITLSKNKSCIHAANKTHHSPQEAKANGKVVDNPSKINVIEKTATDFSKSVSVDSEIPDKISILKLERVTDLNNQNNTEWLRNNPQLNDTHIMDNESVSLKVNEKSHQRVKRSSEFDKMRNLLKNRHDKSEDSFLPGSVQNETRRMVGGRHASISDYPYTVSIEKNGKHTCTGSIVTSYLIITTASCVWRSSRGRSIMKVRAGSTDWSAGGVLIAVSEVMKHPKYDVAKDPDFDISVLKLVRPIKFTNDRSPLELPFKGSVPAFNDAWITGWGARRKDGRMAGETTMEVFHAKYIDHEKCAKAYSKIINVTPNFICFEPFEEIERGPCIGDSGAPAVSDHYLWGVASYGLRGGCGDKGYPAVFTSIASAEITDFIQKVISRYEDRLGNMDISLDRIDENSIKAEGGDKK